MKNRNMKLIPDVPETPAGEMNRLSLAMMQVMKDKYLGEEYTDQFKAIKQALESLNRHTNDIRLMEITNFK